MAGVKVASSGNEESPRSNLREQQPCCYNAELSANNMGTSVPLPSRAAGKQARGKQPKMNKGTQTFSFKCVFFCIHFCVFFLDFIMT